MNSPLLIKSLNSQLVLSGGLFKISLYILQYYCNLDSDSLSTRTATSLKQNRRLFVVPSFGMDTARLSHCLLHILTIGWVLCTPKACQNQRLLFLHEKGRKKKKKAEREFLLSFINDLSFCFYVLLVTFWAQPFSYIVGGLCPPFQQIIFVMFSKKNFFSQMLYKLFHSVIDQIISR